MHFDSMPGDHPALLLFEKWVILADQKKWQVLFQSILEDTGTLYRQDNEDHDRQIINYKSIIQTLEIEAYRNNYCIHDIAAFLNRLRLNTAEQTNASNIQKIDIELPGVQLLTMHASKGLEFKVVFIGGGFTNRDRSLYWTYHRSHQRVFDLIKNDGDRDLHDLERQYEEERLFYVAITRARNRIYIPVFEPTSHSISSTGLIGKKMPRALLTVRNNVGTTLVNHDDSSSIEASCTLDSIKHDKPVIMPNPLFPGMEMNFLNRTLTVDSFSGLKAKLHEGIDSDERNAEFGLVHSIGEDEVIPSIIQLPAERIIPIGDGIPHGIESGLMLHEILEKIDYKKIRDMTSPVDMLEEKFGFNELFDTAIITNLRNKIGDINLLKNEAARIVWNTLHASLDGAELILCEIDNKIHEVEFYYPSHHIRILDTINRFYPGDFIHGFIDMIFEYKEKYYLVDWKSNYIEKGYSNELISKNIMEMNYDLQIQLYTAALIRWLKRSRSDYSFDRDFGGVYYLYLRGIDPNKINDGIFFYKPDKDPELLSSR